jgi:hypothetical protein
MLGNRPHNPGLLPCSEIHSGIPHPLRTECPANTPFLPLLLQAQLVSCQHTLQHRGNLGMLPRSPDRTRQSYEIADTPVRQDNRYWFRNRAQVWPWEPDQCPTRPQEKHISSSGTSSCMHSDDISQFPVLEDISWIVTLFGQNRLGLDRLSEQCTLHLTSIGQNLCNEPRPRACNATPGTDACQVLP